MCFLKLYGSEKNNLEILKDFIKNSVLYNKWGLLSVDDKEIISMFWNRDESAIKNLQKEYGNELMRLSLRILGNMEFYRH